MENLTLGQIGTAVAFLVALITGVSALMKKMREWISSSMKEQFDSMSKDLEGLSKSIRKVDTEATKNYLVSFLAKVEQDKAVDEIETERFWEEYEHYVDDLDGNSYIKQKVQKLKNEAKL